LSGWAPLTTGPGGIPEVPPDWVETNRTEVLVLDVREPDEFTGELGHIPGAMLVPLGQLSARLDELPRNRPVVCVCKSGGRSGKATMLLRQAGFRCANLPGGMSRWRSENRPVEDQS